MNGAELTHDELVLIWSRLPKRELVRLVKNSTPGRWIIGGPDLWSKDELVSYLAHDDAAKRASR